MSIFVGAATAMVTPFDEKGVNLKTYEKQLEYQLANGIAAIVVAGTTGEPATMSNEEKKSLLEFTVKKVNKRVPVIFGSGSYSTKHTVDNSKLAKKLGADGVLIVTPYYNKTTQDGIYGHFMAVADEVDIPIITYNVPSRTGLNLLPTTLQRIAKHENVVAHKEAAGCVRQIMDMVRLCSDDIDIMSGDDSLIFPLLACGGKAWISVISNIMPKQCGKLVSSYAAGDIDRSRQIQYGMDELINQLFVQVNPIPIKCAMNMLGYDMGSVRMPLMDMQGEDRDNLEIALKKMNLL